jgi:hypothetical protein
MRFLRSLVVVCVCLLAFGVVARTETPGIHEVNRVTFAAPIRVGGELLPAGDYVVRHTMEGADHMMVFQSLKHKHPDVKAKCQLIELGNKADQTRTVYALDAAGERVLQELVFGGDTVKHVF